MSIYTNKKYHWLRGVKYSGVEHILLKEVECSMAGQTIISQGSNFYLLAVFF